MLLTVSVSPSCSEMPGCRLDYAVGDERSGKEVLREVLEWFLLIEPESRAAAEL